MRVWNAQQLQQPLRAPILTPAAVQRIEDLVRPSCHELCGKKIVLRIDLNDVEALFVQCLRAATPGHEAHLAFCRTAAEQHGHLLAVGHGTPTRLISHSSNMPDSEKTRPRTSFPNASMSEAVALLVLMRKLQCFPDTRPSSRAIPP